MDTHSTYNNTIQTNLRSDENCTCDEGKDVSSLCNCYKKNTNKTSRMGKSINSQNILIQENNYCTCGKSQNIIPTLESQEKIINTNMTTEDNINTNAKICKKVCICGRGDQEAELINTTTSNNEFQVETL
jgi:tryptophan synthase beta subunit